MSEPIIENYELEQWEEKQYAENITTNTDSNSLQSQKSLGNNQQNTSFESLGGGTAYASPPHSAGALPHTSYPGGAPSGGGDNRRRGHTLAEKRSFLVRMVSDPKCYKCVCTRHALALCHQINKKRL